MDQDARERAMIDRMVSFAKYTLISWCFLFIGWVILTYPAYSTAIALSDLLGRIKLDLILLGFGTVLFVAIKNEKAHRISAALGVLLGIVLIWAFVSFSWR